MASEDSDQFRSGPAVIHRLCDLNDLEQPGRRQVRPCRRAPDTRAELLEIRALCAAQRVPLEERNDYFEQVVPALNAVLQEILAVVVVPAVPIDAPDAEELLELLERGRTRYTLSHDKPMNHLVAGLVADPSSPVGLTDEADGEATFSVYETDDPAVKLDQPFLLIARTVQIFTARTHENKVRRVPDGYSGFPAYSRMLTTLLPMRRAAFYLRTVIVTAAVYRGLVSELRRPKTANPST
jgi:hypothetical protein